MKKSLILSVFPGIDLLGEAFVLEGFCVVRGGDPALGQLGIEHFHPPVNKFVGRALAKAIKKTLKEVQHEKIKSFRKNFRYNI